MKFNADLLTEMQELSPPVSEKKKRIKNLYLRFTISGFKVTISKDLRLELFDDCSHIKFQYKKEIDEKEIETKTGRQKYKKQIITVFGVNEDDRNSLEIQQKGEDGHKGTYYFIKLRKSQMAELDETLLSRINHVTSRKYVVPESAINYDLKCLQIDLENRKKPYYFATRKSDKVVKNQKERKEFKKKQALEQAKKEQTNKTSKSGDKGITTTETGAHQIGSS
ncbi:MAG: hypothetical protein CMB97_02175 [Flavobacteriaceae bacterium]|nr:hypothetical protein [Flavobacteriaceae bacterium]